MTKYFCEQVIAPGIVVVLPDSETTTWGVTMPYDYWRNNSKKDIIARFKQNSREGSPTIPYLEFSNGEEWRFRFGSFPNDLQPLCWLDDFNHDKSKAVPAILSACSRRDGGRYYRELFDQLWMFARGTSKLFTQEALIMESEGTQKLILHARAIRAWQLENLNWRGWRSPYESKHRLHVSLF